MSVSTTLVDHTWAGLFTSLPNVQFDLRALWSVGGRKIFEEWFLGTSLLVKPLVVGMTAPVPWTKSIPGGVAMSLAGFFFVAFVPIPIVFSMLLADGLMRRGLGVNPPAAVSFALLALVSILIASGLDMCVLTFALRQSATRRLRFVTLLGNIFCVLVATFMLMDGAVHAREPLA